MFKYLLINLSNSSTSFCHYESNINDDDLIDFDKLKKAIDFCKRNNIIANYLFGIKNINEKYLKLIESIDHIKMVPLESFLNFPESIVIINPNDLDLLSKIRTSDNYIILRLLKKDLLKLAEIIKSLLGKFKKLNLVLLEIENYTEKDIEEYKTQINSIKIEIINELRSNNNIGVNFITDSWFLSKMNNCDAGLQHITLAPNGKYYICPGFYYSNKNDFIGLNIDEIKIKNLELLNLRNAPICRSCDAFHCKRCFYLNKKMTLEINTPSFQQCYIAHHERNLSNDILRIFINKKNYRKFRLKPKISYIDPFTIIDNEEYYLKNKDLFI